MTAGALRRTLPAAVIIGVLSVAAARVLASPSPTLSATPTRTATPQLTPVPNVISVVPRVVLFPGDTFAVPGQRSEPATVKVTNSSRLEVVTVLPPKISDEFIITANECPRELMPDNSCTIRVAFEPTSTGIRRGTLQIVTNEINGPQKVKLRGRGVAPRLALMPKRLKFERVSGAGANLAQSVALTNISSVPITLTAAPAATPPFNVSANTCRTLVANGGTCSISVAFEPTGPGTFNGTLEIHDNAAGSPHQIKLHGVAN